MAHDCLKAYSVSYGYAHWPKARYALWRNAMHGRARRRARRGAAPRHPSQPTAQGPHDLGPVGFQVDEQRGRRIPRYIRNQATSCLYDLCYMSPWVHGAQHSTTTTRARAMGPCASTACGWWVPHAALTYCSPRAWRWSGHPSRPPQRALRYRARG